MKFIRNVFGKIDNSSAISRNAAIGLSERIAAITTLTSSLEYLSQSKQMRVGGLNDWRFMRKGESGQPQLVRKMLDVISIPKVTTAVHGAKILASISLLMPGHHRYRGIANIFLATSTLLLTPRHRYGTDGSDQVSVLVQSAMGIARTTTNRPVADAMMWYVAIQSNLSYLVSGWAKLLGEDWRKGRALTRILRTKTYGSKVLYEFLKNRPALSATLQYLVLAMECTFPVVYLGHGRFLKAYLITAGSFHVGTGFVMGLGRFMTAFPSMFPAVAYTAVPNGRNKARDDRVLGAISRILIVGVAVAAIIALQKRLQILETGPDTRTLITRSGNSLRYRSLASKEMRPDSPIIIMVPGLASTAEHFSWIAEKLTATGVFETIVFNRAGYADSHRLASLKYSLQESVDDVRDLVDGVVESEASRSIYLLGHSLGGEIVRRVAGQAEEGLITGLILLDPSHPNELNRSKAQKVGAQALLGLLNLTAVSLRIGAGVLMARPGWVYDLPRPVRNTVFAQYSDARLWAAAAREWKAVEVEFSNFDGKLADVECPALLLAAQNTIESDAEQWSLYGGLIECFEIYDRDSQLVVVDDSEHDTILTNPRSAHEVAGRISDFVDVTRLRG